MHANTNSRHSRQVDDWHGRSLLFWLVSRSHHTLKHDRPLYSKRILTALQNVIPYSWSKKNKKLLWNEINLICQIRFHRVVAKKKHPCMWMSRSECCAVMCQSDQNDVWQQVVKPVAPITSNSNWLFCVRFFLLRWPSTLCMHYKVLVGSTLLGFCSLPEYKLCCGNKRVTVDKRCN